MLLNLLLLGAVLLLLYFIFRNPQRLDLPGPWGLPIVGNLFRLNASHPHLKLSQWAKKYGGAYALRLLRDNYLVLSDHELIREALSERGNDFSGRPHGVHRIDLGTFNHSEVMYQNQDAPSWSLVRDSVEQTMAKQEGLANAEAAYEGMLKQFLDKLTPIKNAVAENRHECRSDICNYITRSMLYLTLGKTLDEDSKVFSKVQTMERLYASAMSMAGQGSELDAFPVLRLFNNSTYGKIMWGKGLVVQVWEQISPDLKKPPSASKLDSLMHSLTRVQDENRAPNGHPIVKDLNLMCNMASLLITGISTLTNTTYASINILAHYPDVQSKIQQEVDSVIQDGRLPRPADQPKMPYGMAAVYELLRYTSIMPLGVPHASTRDTTIANTFIPEGTILLPNIWQVHHDQMFWGDPWVYRPERFLDLKGGLLPADSPIRKRLYPFGAGPRGCPAENWSVTRVFLFLTSLLQKYEIKFAPVPYFDLPSCDPRTYELGQVLSPKRSMQRFKLRGFEEVVSKLE